MNVMTTAEAEPSQRQPRMPGMVEFICMMAGLIALTALSIDIMLPALGLIQSDFHVASANERQLVITAFILGFAGGQLFFGPLSDRIGRRPVVMAGLVFYAIASLLCIFANSFELLLAARLLQGIASASPRIMAVAIIRDRFEGRRMAEVMSFVMLVFIMVPVLAPSFGGGILLLAGNWRMIFALLTGICIAVMIWAALHLPETKPAEMREPMSLGWLAGAFGEVLRTRMTMGYTLATGAVFGSLLSYINSAQQIFSDIYGAGEWFPVLFGSVAAAIALASLLNSRIVRRVGMRILSHASLCGFAAVALLHLGYDQIIGQPPMWLFMLFLGGNLFCFGFIMPNFNAIAMEPMGRIAGTASSLSGALMTALGAICGWYVGQHYNGTVTPLLVGFLCFAALAFVLVLVTERGRLFVSHHQP
jgi:MFS transporter, DHA1 family, multidrug resistance protein